MLSILVAVGFFLLCSQCDGFYQFVIDFAIGDTFPDTALSAYRKHWEDPSECPSGMDTLQEDCRRNYSYPAAFVPAGQKSLYWQSRYKTGKEVPVRQRLLFAASVFPVPAGPRSRKLRIGWVPAVVNCMCLQMLSTSGGMMYQSSSLGICICSFWGKGSAGK